MHLTAWFHRACLPNHQAPRTSTECVPLPVSVYLFRHRSMVPPPASCGEERHIKHHRMDDALSGIHRTSLEPRGGIELPRPRRRSHGCDLAFCYCTRHIKSHCMQSCLVCALDYGTLWMRFCWPCIDYNYFYSYKTSIHPVPTSTNLA